MNNQELTKLLEEIADDLVRIGKKMRQAIEEAKKPIKIQFDTEAFVKIVSEGIRNECKAQSAKRDSQT